MPRPIQEIQKAYEELFLYYVESPERLKECFAKAQPSRFPESNGTTLDAFLADYFHPSDRRFLGKDLRSQLGVILLDERYKDLADADLFLLDLVHQQVLAELENDLIELQTQMQDKPGQAGLFAASPTLKKLAPEFPLFECELVWAGRDTFFNKEQWARLVAMENPEDDAYRDESRFNALSKSNLTQVIDSGFYIGLGASVGACIGAAVGSVVPIIGTSIGALIGSLIGAGAGSTKTGLYDLSQTHHVASSTLTTLGSAGVGAGIGALLGTLIPIPGLGTFVGMAIGAGIGAAIAVTGGLITAGVQAYRRSKAKQAAASQEHIIIETPDEQKHPSNYISTFASEMDDTNFERYLVQNGEQKPRRGAKETQERKLHLVSSDAQASDRNAPNPKGKVSALGIYSGSAQAQVTPEDSTKKNIFGIGING
ncbi:Uncharacterised protein [Legionella beliardensis]|uniref:Glycine zipper domain-containing protein n=1 Tax=Legionella beliardensis TaxID=91822 RepID=A0A378HYS6_9GAMM|nr:hypothetical protein [Legionella beliardensis]STX27630.1 Uncharacterised protein [Legionella beliardensis]